MSLHVSRVAKTYGPSVVLDDISFIINAGDRVGLVGANGTGKSTLFRIITGEIPADSGTVSVSEGIVLGYLPQQPPDSGNTTINDLVYDAVGELRSIETRLRELEASLSDPAADFDEVMAEYGELQEQFERRGGYDLDHRIDVVRDGLRIGHIPRTRHFSSLSGGEKSRVLLSTLLLRSPDLLLLDEPTNHLDFATIGGLEEYIVGYHGTMLTISHDRHFLNRSVTSIIEIDERTRQANVYVGNYDAYSMERDREERRWRAEYEAQQEEIRELRRVIKIDGRQVAPNRPARDPAKTAYDFKGGRVQEAISRNVRSAEERLRRIETDPVPRPPSELRIRPEMKTDELRSERIIGVSGVSKAFADVPVLRDVSFSLGPGDRVVIVGENGAGKSTLLDIILGRTQPDGGTVQVARSAGIGFLDQDAAILDPRATVLDAFQEGLGGYEQDNINELFRYGLFAVDDLAKQVALLSSGERRKLQIARLIAAQANMLLLDEPTNHLSLDVLEKFEHALSLFPGPILAVSHDRWFIERFNGQVWELRHGQLIQHLDNPTHVLAGLMSPDCTM